MSEEFDVIVVGGGPAGEHAAGRGRKHGLSVAVVESELVGGECSYWACIPSKTLLRPGQALADVRQVPGASQAVTGGLDTAAALERRNWMVNSWSDESQVSWLNNAGATLVRGHGRLRGERVVEVEGPDGEVTELRASKAVVLAVGSSAAIPPIPGLADARPWTNRGATALQEAPESLLVLGGGVVGVELSQAWRRLGCPKVTLLEAAPRVLATMEPFASEYVTQALEADGITVRTGAEVVGVRRDNETVTVTLESGEEVQGSEILAATGRRPRSADLGLEVVGLEPGRYVPTDDLLQVEGAPWLYAIGDVNGRALLTHIGKYQARVVIDRIAGIDRRDVVSGKAVPAVVFTDPQVASVGLTEAEAREAGSSVRVVSTELSAVPAAAIYGEHCVGKCQLVVDEDRQVIIGATFVGPGLGDALHAATIAVVGEVPMGVLKDAVASFPSMSEIWLELVESYLAA